MPTKNFTLIPDHDFRQHQPLATRAQLPVSERSQIVTHELVHVSSTGSGYLLGAHPTGPRIAATSSTSPARTSAVSGVAAGAGTRSVASSGTPIVPAAPPSHTYRRPFGKRRSNSTASRCPRSG